MRNSMFYTCKEATKNISRMEEGRLNLPGRLRLHVHLMMCAFCRRFLKQTTQIIELTKSAPQHAMHLSDEQKKRLQQKTDLS
jgi:hypothetical protein